jgi:hypothetical protein
MRSADDEDLLDLEEDYEFRPKTPDVAMEDDEVANTEFDYTDRHPTDWVVSGPLKDSSTPGRRFKTFAAAEVWAREFYGERFIRRVPETAIGGRWGFLIKGVRCS